MFIKYKDQPVVNVKNIVDIFYIDSDEDFSRHEYCQKLGLLYLIQFRSLNMGKYSCSDSLWLFKTKEERDEVYAKVLKMIEVKEIVWYERL